MWNKTRLPHTHTHTHTLSLPAIWRRQAGMKRIYGELSRSCSSSGRITEKVTERRRESEKEKRKSVMEGWNKGMQ